VLLVVDWCVDLLMIESLMLRMLMRSIQLDGCG